MIVKSCLKKKNNKHVIPTSSVQLVFAMSSPDAPLLGSLFALLLLAPASYLVPLQPAALYGGTRAKSEFRVSIQTQSPDLA